MYIYAHNHSIFKTLNRESSPTRDAYNTSHIHAHQDTFHSIASWSDMTNPQMTGNCARVGAMPGTEVYAHQLLHTHTHARTDKEKQKPMEIQSRGHENKLSTAEMEKDTQTRVHPHGADTKLNTHQQNINSDTAQTQTRMWTNTHCTA